MLGEYLDVVLHGVVLGLLRDQEPHVSVLDFRRGWSNDFSGHPDSFMYSCYLRVWCWGGGRGGAQFVICCNALHWTERPIDLFALAVNYRIWLFRLVSGFTTACMNNLALCQFVV